MPELSETRRIRKRLGLTQEAMARRVGVALRTFTRWDTGETQPREPALRLMRSLAPPKKKKKRGA